MNKLPCTVWWRSVLIVGGSCTVGVKLPPWHSRVPIALENGQILIKAKHIHALWFRHACFNCLSQKYKNICTQRDLDRSLLNSLIHNSPRLEASQVSILRWVDDRLGYRAWWNTLLQQYQGASWSLCKNRLSKRTPAQIVPGGINPLCAV